MGAAIFFVYLWCDVTGVVMASCSRLRASSSSEEEDVARRNGGQPYRFEPRSMRSRNGDEESDSGELTLRYLIQELSTFCK